MLDGHTAADIGLEVVDRLGGIVGLDDLYREGHTSDPEHAFIIDDQRVIVRPRDDVSPATVDVGPYPFEVRDHRLVNVTT